MNIEQAKTIPVIDILHKMDLKPDRISGYDLYKSPLRTERTASFHVNTRKNVWFDHGLGIGGDSIKLICLYLQSIQEDHTPADALRWLRNMVGNSPAILPMIEERKDPPNAARLIFMKAYSMHIRRI